jgi:hypothetical protein
VQRTSEDTVGELENEGEIVESFDICGATNWSG